MTEAQENELADMITDVAISYANGHPTDFRIAAKAAVAFVRDGDTDVNMDCLKEVIDWIGVDKKQIIAVGGVPKYEIEIRAIASNSIKDAT